MRDPDQDSEHAATIAAYCFLGLVVLILVGVVNFLLAHG